MLVESGTRFGHYEVEARLGAGGMGEVYRARDSRLGRQVALKCISQALTSENENVRRFEHEARAASALNHPNIVTVHDFGSCELGRFIVMELIEGRTLRPLIKDRPALPVAIDIAAQIARALSTAHRAGIVHRDIKPDNVMVRADGIVKIVDFGLARLTDNLLASPSHAETNFSSVLGVVRGTPRYMSPEQALGESLTPSSDMFSFGIMLFELVSGRHPFPVGDPTAVMRAIIEADPLSLSDAAPEVPIEVASLVAQLLSRDPADRPTAQSTVAALTALHNPSATVPITRLRPLHRRRRSIATASGPPSAWHINGSKPARA